MLYHEGLAFADPGANRLRYEPIPRFSEKHGGKRLDWFYEASFALTTLPGSRIVAFAHGDDLYVVSEDRKEVTHTAKVGRHTGDGRSPALAFLTPHSVALHHLVESPGSQMTGHTEIWECPPQGKPHRTAEHKGPVLDRWPLDEWMRPCIDGSFVARVLAANEFGWLDEDLPWLRGAAEPDVPGPRPVQRTFLALSPWGDMLATVVDRWGLGDRCEVHSPHLPSARELLERPLLHSSPQDLRRVRDVRANIGDPAVRDALDLLATCLGERFGGDIALGDGTGATPAGGTTDIALGKDRTE